MEVRLKRWKRKRKYRCSHLDRLFRKMDVQFLDEFMNQRVIIINSHQNASVHGTVIGITDVLMDAVSIKGELELRGIVVQGIFIHTDVNGNGNFWNFNGEVSLSTAQDFAPDQASCESGNRRLIDGINRLSSLLPIEEDAIGTVVDLKRRTVFIHVRRRPPLNLKPTGCLRLRMRRCAQLFTEARHGLNKGGRKILRSECEVDLLHHGLAQKATLPGKSIAHGTTQSSSSS